MLRDSHNLRSYPWFLEAIFFAVIVFYLGQHIIPTSLILGSSQIGPFPRFSLFSVNLGAVRSHQVFCNTKIGCLTHNETAVMSGTEDHRGSALFSSQYENLLLPWYKCSCGSWSWSPGWGNAHQVCVLWSYSSSHS